MEGPVDHSRVGWVPQPDPTKLTTDAVNALERKLREYYDLRFEQLDLRLEQRFQAQSKSLDAALISADLKSDALSDKLGQLSLDMKGNITRPEYESAHKALLDKIDDVRARYYEQSGISSGANVTQQLRDIHNSVAELRLARDTAYGQAQAQPTTAAQISELAAEVRALRDYKESATGRGAGGTAMWGYIAAGIFLLIAIVTFMNNQR